MWQSKLIAQNLFIITRNYKNKLFVGRRDVSFIKIKRYLIAKRSNILVSLFPQFLVEYLFRL